MHIILLSIRYIARKFFVLNIKINLKQKTKFFILWKFKESTFIYCTAPPPAQEKWTVVDGGVVLFVKSFAEKFHQNSKNVLYK